MGQTRVHMCVFPYGILPMSICSIMLIRFSYIVQQACKEASLRHLTMSKNFPHKLAETFNFCRRQAIKPYPYFCKKQLTAGVSFFVLVTSHSLHLKYLKAWERGKIERLEYSLVHGSACFFLPASFQAFFICIM